MAIYNGFKPKICSGNFMQIIYCIDNKLGGITSLNYNVIKNRPADGPHQYVINIDQKESTYTKANIRFPADKEFFFTYSVKDNAYAVIKRLFQLIPPGPGALVLNDSLEMQMLDHYKTEKTVYQLVHDEYNFGLAQHYGHIVDIFIAHSRFFYDKLNAALPNRAADIHFLPHGVSIPANYRVQHEPDQPLKLLFLGRMTHTKGIFDLPVIDGYLNEWQIPHSWTCIGNGPELPALKQTWTQSAKPVQYVSPATGKEVMEICATHDVFVLPTQFEGSPVSLLETMSAGLVPVITDLPGGIREIVEPAVGFRPPMGDTRGFAAAIQTLANNRALLQQMSETCRQKIIREFNVADTAARYHQLFAAYRTLYKPKVLKKEKIGSRLDQPWIPEIITQTLRSF